MSEEQQRRQSSLRMGPMGGGGPMGAKGERAKDFKKTIIRLLGISIKI